MPSKPLPITIDSVLHLLPLAPSVTTRQRDWSGVTVDLYRPAPNCSATYSAFDHHALYYIPVGSGRLVQGRDGVVHEAVISAGMSAVMPAGHDSSWDGDVPASARMRMPTALIDAAAEQMGKRSAHQVEIRNVFQMRDPLIERVAQMFISELERRSHPAQVLIADALSCALAAHMVRSLNAFDVTGSYDPPPLGRAQLAQVMAFIEENLERPITLSDLAAVVNVSRFHFARLFKRSTGMTAIAYVEQCRLRRAQSLIAGSDIPLSQIALIAGFADQSHFTRRFHKHFGRTPAAFAREQGRRRSQRHITGGG
jgi:AraC family transcriptional regulator